MLIAFKAYLYYGDADTYTVNANPSKNVKEAAQNAQELTEKLGASAFALYDPRQDSNGHFFGPCIKTFHSYGTQIHRPEEILSAGRWALSHNVCLAIKE